MGLIPSTNFYHKLLRKYTAMFGNIFNDIHVSRVDDTDTEVQNIKIPLTHANKKKFYYHYVQGLKEKPYSLTLPRMSFGMTGLMHDPARQLDPTIKLRHIDNLDPNVLKTIYRPVPYNLQFILGIWTKNIDDSFQIIEQILPYFTPSYNVSINEFPVFGINRDVKITLEDISFDLSDELTEATDSIRFDSRTLSFMIEGYLYPPITDVGIIKKINVYLRQQNYNYPYIHITDEINPSTANWNDEWDIIETSELVTEE